ncbi:hypothetical protein N7532_000214 [Penicillium argentinense]|uniref:Uncharacterized protein n=1 Tax=Penicillium argentinense TaxID=1131581 RepID=A0A9W9KMF0_9EURO|nr:uncharacterized protein N7532_000214 [Penicillium argentinense]KAJ5112169.1 hypothetical protein N7532_000214 [Penicillium argentinense]
MASHHHHAIIPRPFSLFQPATFHVTALSLLCTASGLPVAVAVSATVAAGARLNNGAIDRHDESGSLSPQLPASRAAALSGGYIEHLLHCAGPEPRIEKSCDFRLFGYTGRDRERQTRSLHNIQALES